jgi:hypothetical protein
LSEHPARAACKPLQFEFEPILISEARVRSPVNAADGDKLKKLNIAGVNEKGEKQWQHPQRSLHPS